MLLRLAQDPINLYLVLISYKYFWYSVSIYCLVSLVSISTQLTRKTNSAKKNFSVSRNLKQLCQPLICHLSSENRRSSFERILIVHITSSGIQTQKPDLYKPSKPPMQPSSSQLQTNFFDWFLGHKLHCWASFTIKSVVLHILEGSVKGHTTERLRKKDKEDKKVQKD